MMHPKLQPKTLLPMRYQQSRAQYRIWVGSCPVAGCGVWGVQLKQSVEVESVVPRLLEARVTMGHGGDA
jgi:hypothetical protein